RAQPSRTRGMKRLDEPIQPLPNFPKLRCPGLPFFLSKHFPSLPRSVQLLEYRSFVGFRRVQLQAKVTKTACFEPPIDNVERCHLLGDEQYSASQTDVVSDDVSDGFRLASAWRSFQHEVPITTRGVNGDNLRAISIQGRHQVRRIELPIDRAFRQEPSTVVVRLARRFD